MLFLNRILRNRVAALFRWVHAHPDGVHLLDFPVLTFGKFCAVLRRNHSAAIIDSTFQQRIPRIVAVLRLHVQNQTNQAVLARCCGVKADIVADCPLAQSCIFGVDPVDCRIHSVGFVNINAYRANLRLTLDVLLGNVLGGTIAVFRDTFFHDDGQNALVGQQALDTLIVAGINICLGDCLRQIIFFLLHRVSASFPCLYYTLFLYFLQ